MIQIKKEILELFLPEDVLEYFYIVDGKNDNGIHIFLEEKNIPPISKEELNNRKIISKGFFDITVSDFPIRGKRAAFTFRRRRWKVEGQEGLLKRDIKLCADGTQLEKKFGDFLKDRS